MMAKKQELEPHDFIAALEDGIRALLSDPDATPSEKSAAISAGVKLALARHKIEGGDEGNFFSK